MNLAITKYPNFSEENSEMLASIRSLPIIPVIYNLTPDQEGWLKLKAWEWDFIANFITWRQLQELGYSSAKIPVTFFETAEQESIIEELISFIIAKANIYYFTFQLIVECFYLIKEQALSQGREFPFSDAYILFSKILLELSEDESQDVFRKTDTTKINFTKLKRGLTRYKNLWKGSLKEEKIDQALDSYKHSPYWCDFWIYPVWQHQVSGDKKSRRFKYLSESYLESLQIFSDLVFKPNKNSETSFGVARWEHGYAFDPKSGRKIAYSY